MGSEGTAQKPARTAPFERKRRLSLEPTQVHGRLGVRFGCVGVWFMMVHAGQWPVGVAIWLLRGVVRAVSCRFMAGWGRDLAA